MRCLFPVLIMSMLICSMLIGPAGAVSGPSFNGYTGLLNVPTAYSLSLANYNAGVYFDNHRTNIVGNLGLLPGLEVGAASIKPEHAGAELTLNAKYELRGEGTIWPAIAVGVFDIADSFDVSPYMVASKSLTPIGRELFNPMIHVGVGGGSFDGVFAGISADIAQKVTLMAEYDTEDVNIGARFWVSPNLSVSAGLFGGASELGAGIAYSRKM
jgi:hypothetical protein